MNDQEHNLIQAARNGDQAAFGELVQQYQKRVFALAVRMCPTPELAESFLNGRRGGTVYHRRRGTKKVPENLKKFFPGKNCACLVVYHRILVLKRVFGGFQARKAVLTQGSVGRGSVKKGGMAKNLHGF